jgi:hypothetical protein
VAFEEYADLCVLGHAASKLDAYLQRTTQSKQPRTLDEAVPEALRLWRQERASDSDLRSLIDGSKWVRLELRYVGVAESDLRRVA